MVNARKLFASTKSEENLPDLIKSFLDENPGTLLLDYYIYQGKIKIFVCNAKNINIYNIEESEETVGKIIREFYDDVNLYIASKEYRDAGWGMDTDPPETLKRLGGILTGPVVDLIPGYDQLIIVPQGILHKVPFGALNVIDNKYLADYCAVSIAYSSEALLAQTNNDIIGQNRNVILRGSEDGLDGVTDEIESLKTVFGNDLEILGTTGILDSDARAKLAERLREASVIHYTGHSEFDPDLPNASSLVLESGHRLTVSEISSGEFNFSQARIVSLAGCETGMGDVRTGDEVISLARAFIEAGAGSVLVSLWKVSDLATSKLIPSFYRAWIAGETPSQALQTAVKGMLSEARMHPYFWAPFQIVGKSR
jgi:CHAT domain-containing protein